VVALDLPTSHTSLQGGDTFTMRMFEAINGMMLDMLAASPARITRIAPPSGAGHCQGESGRLLQGAPRGCRSQPGEGTELEFYDCRHRLFALDLEPAGSRASGFRPVTAACGRCSVGFSKAPSKRSLLVRNAILGWRDQAIFSYGILPVAFRRLSVCI
jgi:hypothetical protein